MASGDSGDVSEEELSRALDLAEVAFERDVCETTLAALSEKDGEFIGAMAVDEGRSRVADVAERMGVSFDYAQKYRKRLIDSGVIEAAGRGYVTFAVPYLGDYLRREAQA